MPVEVTFFNVSAFVSIFALCAYYIAQFVAGKTPHYREYGYVLSAVQILLIVLVVGYNAATGGLLFVKDIMELTQTLWLFGLVAFQKFLELKDEGKLEMLFDSKTKSRTSSRRRS